LRTDSRFFQENKVRKCLILLLILLQIFYLAFPSDLLCQASTARVLKVTGSRITVYTEKKIDWEIGSKCLFKYQRPLPDLKLIEVVDSAKVVLFTANTADLDLFDKKVDLKGVSLVELTIIPRSFIPGLALEKKDTTSVTLPKVTITQQPVPTDRLSFFKKPGLTHKWYFWVGVGVVTGIVFYIIFKPGDDNKENLRPGRISIHIPAN
jgi:hypothetical protein